MASIIKYITIMIKSFFFEGNCNYANMQGTGFAWIVRPCLKDKLTKEDSARLYEYFNTNPSFITLATSIFVKEFNLNHGNGFKARSIYGPALAALGDSFFNHALRPFLFLVTLFVAFYITPWGVLLYPLVFTSFNTSFLILGQILGEKSGVGAIRVLRRFQFSRWAGIADNISIFLVGVFLSKLLKDYSSGNYPLILICLLFLGLGFTLYRFVRLNIFLVLIVLLVLVSLLFYGGYELWINH